MIPGVVKIFPKQIKDARGYFSEVYNEKGYEKLGVGVCFVQDNISLSKKVGTIRGLHYQSPPNAQGKLVRCGRGEIFDVALDIRNGSPTYGKWVGHNLSAENGHQLYIPVGFAHGFLTLASNSEIAYKCTNYYAPDAEGALRWDSCGIEWPLSSSPILSPKDAAAHGFVDFHSPFIYGVNS